MTDPEFSVFAKRLFVTFPDVWEWLHANSPDPQETQKVWRSTLRDYTLEECLLVIDSWITGKRPVFKAYERAQIALIVRQACQFDREKERQRTNTGEASNEYRKTRRQDYKPLALNIPELRPIYERGVALRKKWLDGNITDDQYEEQKRILLEEVK